MSMTAKSLVPAGVVGYQAMVQADVSFARDQVHVLLSAKTREGRHLAHPADVVFAEPISPIAVLDGPPEPFLTLDTDAAKALFDALAAYFLGTSDVARLQVDLARERKRVDALIAGIGRTGGVVT